MTVDRGGARWPCRGVPKRRWKQLIDGSPHDKQSTGCGGRRSAICLSSPRLLDLAFRRGGEAGAWRGWRLCRYARMPRRKVPTAVDLSDSQLDAVKVAPVEAPRPFRSRRMRSAASTSMRRWRCRFSRPMRGRIIALFGSVGDDVKKGQTLFTIDSPDLLQAESTLISAAGRFGSRHQEPATSA